jgi:hypothetical protein
VLADPEGNEFCLQPGLEQGVCWSAICQDAADPGAQSRFWALAAGLRVVRQGEWGVAMAVRDAASRAPLLVMGPPVAEKEGTNRLLLGLSPNQGSAAAVEASRLVAVGARRDGGMLLDPEDNEFRIGD